MEQAITPATVATVEIPAESYGISHFWAQGDSVTHMVALILLLMSILSWTQIALKSWRASRHKRTRQAVENFWQAATLEDAVAGIVGSDNTTPFAELARQVATANVHFDVHSGRTIGGSTERGEFLTRALRQSIMHSTARLESGLTMLASIGSIAPFVGLFGTVWGIYHALLAIASTGSASIDKVSGPVGEALIMTAAGLFVAIPAVLAYNAFTRLRLLQLANSLAATCCGELDIVSCWHFEHEEYLHGSTTRWIRISKKELDELVAKRQSEHRATLDALIHESAITGGEYRIQHIKGLPEQSIPDFIEKNGIDILVMGTVARTGIYSFVIGNTAENILQKLSCSLLALKPNGFVSPVKAY